MQPLYQNCYEMDKRCYDQYGLTEDILMENASMGMANYIRKHFKKKSKVLIVAGFGNNGADGIVLARLLQNEYKIRLYLPFPLKSAMAKIQYQRIEALGIKCVNEVKKADILIDCLFGAGLSRALDEPSQEIIACMNRIKGFKIACDIPSGIDEKGNPSPIAFVADTTMTMGALKQSLYMDNSKAYVGEVICVDLGLPFDKYTEGFETDVFLLEEDDSVLPSRTQTNTHKGTFGHLSVIAGEKEGASLLSSLASLRFGVGLVTMIGEMKTPLPYSIMQNKTMPYNTSAIAFGMGFGSDWNRIDEVLDSPLPIILDADIFHHEMIEKFLAQTSREIVLTPHPKEFVSLFIRVFKRHLDIPLEVENLQKHRLYYVRAFTKEYPHITLLLKGSNMIIAQDQKCFINPHGTAKLSKGGSGDVLSGLIGALLAQGYTPLEASIQASLALTAGANAYKGSSYSMLPTDLIEEIGKLEKNSRTF